MCRSKCTLESEITVIVLPIRTVVSLRLVAAGKVHGSLVDPADFFGHRTDLLHVTLSVLLP